MGFVLHSSKATHCSDGSGMVPLLPVWVISLVSVLVSCPTVYLSFLYLERIFLSKRFLTFLLLHYT